MLHHSKDQGELRQDEEGPVPGSVEEAIRAHVRPGDRLPTPTGRAAFIVRDLDAGGVVVLLGAKQARNLLTWQCLEGIPGDLRGRGWVAIAASREVNGKPGTLDGYLKSWIKVQVANYVAVLLERARVVELDRGRPARVRLLARAGSAGLPARRRAEADGGERVLNSSLVQSAWSSSHWTPARIGIVRLCWPSS
jgi:hypothetical protein